MMKSKVVKAFILFLITFTSNSEVKTELNGQELYLPGCLDEVCKVNYIKYNTTLNTLILKADRISKLGFEQN